MAKKMPLIDFKKQWYPENYPVIVDLTAEQLKLNILRFAWYYGHNICPEKNLDAFVKRVKSVNHCACHNERLSCPCAKGIVELITNGYCSCRLFVDNDYLKVIQERIMRKMRENPDTFRPDK